MSYKMKPMFRRNLDKFGSMLIAALVSATLALAACFSDMIIFDKGMKDEVAPWVIEVTKYLICGFPLTWYMTYQCERVQYFFKEYLPWKKHLKEWTAERAARDLVNERKSTELFIRNVRRK
ncbi:hypothetical protein AU156_gp142 [Edwardsiella phage PEi20]|uniref:Uncharacterized protein n=1 Tax=Edwardsiella phage PEi20 TaxID=1608310 RepID=A0A0B6VL37_9CAUD|nr:hypothetical protein AU156_gp142 [Edwardsiella phage PEi20]BAQ22792.1 hypothetical protein [Edwardsiella phage PEi20]